MAFSPADQPPIGRPSLEVADGRPGTGATVSGDLPEVGASYVWLMVLAVFGVFMAFVTPIAISLAIRVAQLAPGHEEYLGYIIGAGGIAAVLAAPLFGMLSDRTRTRLGRRRPFLIGLTVVGGVALLVMAQASGIIVLGLGLGPGADQLGNDPVAPGDLAGRPPAGVPARQGRGPGRSRPAARPCSGCSSGGRARGRQPPAVPGAGGRRGGGHGAVRLPRARAGQPPMTARAPLTVLTLARTYVFDPRENPDFAWNWLGKFLFMCGLTFNTTFTAFFLASRMGVSVEQVTGMVAALAGGSIVAAMFGAVGGGFLSDKLRRRRVFVLLGACVFAAGAVIMGAVAHRAAGRGRNDHQLPRHRPVLRRRSGARAGRAARTRDRRRSLHRPLRFLHVDPAGCRAPHRAGLPGDRRDRRGEELHPAVSCRGRPHRVGGLPSPCASGPSAE